MQTKRWLTTAAILGVCGIGSPVMADETADAVKDLKQQNELLNQRVKILEEQLNQKIKALEDQLDQKVKVDSSWKAITVSARMRTRDYKSGKGSAQDARVALAFRDSADQRIGKWPPVPEVREESPSWVTRTATADVPPGAVTLLVQCAISNSTGTVDFDDVKVIPQK